LRIEDATAYGVIVMAAATGVGVGTGAGAGTGAAIGVGVGEGAATGAETTSTVPSAAHGEIFCHSSVAWAYTVYLPVGSEHPTTASFDHTPSVLVPDFL